MTEATIQIPIGESAPDGDTGGVLAMIDVSKAEVAILVAHRLGRVPVKAYVVESTRKFFRCYVVYKDDQQIQLVFNDAGGTALVRIA
jgi:hypothetical protein